MYFAIHQHLRLKVLLVGRHGPARVLNASTPRTSDAIVVVDDLELVAQRIIRVRATRGDVVAPHDRFSAVSHHRIQTILQPLTRHTRRTELTQIELFREFDAVEYFFIVHPVPPRIPNLIKAKEMDKQNLRRL